VTVSSSEEIEPAVAKINAAGKGTLIWGKGTFSVPAFTGTHTHLYFANLTELKIIGQGTQHTTLIQDIAAANATKQLRLCSFENIGTLDISNFSVNGQREQYELELAPDIGENTRCRVYSAR